MEEILVCEKCGHRENPDTFNGLRCPKCGGRMIPVKATANQLKEPP